MADQGVGQEQLEKVTSGQEKINNYSSKKFVEDMRKKYYDKNPNIKLLDYEKINKELNNLVQKISQKFGADADKVFELIKDFPVDHLEELIKHGFEFLEKYEKDVKDDLQNPIDAKLQNGYITTILDFLQNKKIEQKKEQDKQEAEKIAQKEQQVKELEQKDKQIIQQDKQVIQQDTQVKQQKQFEEEKVKSQIREGALVKKETEIAVDNKTVAVDNKKIDVQKNVEDVKENLSKFEKVLKNKEAVHTDKTIAQHFNTPEYNKRKREIALELEKPEFKAKVKEKLGKDIPTEQLADMVVTNMVISENNLNTASAQDFRTSYKALDEVLHLGHTSTGEFGKNSNVLYNKSYDNLINKPKKQDVLRLDYSKPELGIRATEIAVASNPSLFQGDFMQKYKEAATNPQKMEEFQKTWTPEQAKALEDTKGFIDIGLTKSSRIDAAMAYNDFVGNMFDTTINNNSGSKIVFVKTGDEKLSINENVLQSEFQIQGTDCKLEIQDGKISMTNLLKKDPANKQYMIGTEELPISQIQKLPTFQDIVEESKLASSGNDAVSMLDNVSTLNDMADPSSTFRKRFSTKVKEMLVKRSADVKKEELSQQVGEYAEKYYNSTKLLSYYVPPQREYRFQNKDNPRVDPTQVGQADFYRYLDILRNTFYDGNNPATAQEMTAFTQKLDNLISNKKVDPKEFFSKLVKKDSTDKHGFIKVKPGTGDEVIDLDMFAEYAKQFDKVSEGDNK